ncbi:hypothetical protein ABPG75_001805 [Micractinium tetrahymenae]
MVLLGPRREEKPVARKVGAERRASGSATGRGRNGSGKAPTAQQQRGVGRGGSAAVRPAAPAKPNVLQQLADRVQQHDYRPVQHGRVKDAAATCAAGQPSGDDVAALVAAIAAAREGGPLRHDVLASLAELLGAPQNAAAYEGPLSPAAVAQQVLPAALHRPQEQKQRPSDEDDAPAMRSPAGSAQAAPSPADFSKRNMARLGGEGVAGIFSSGASEPARCGAAAADKAAGYMSALHSLKPGLSDQQAARQAAQREQLKRDLEEQMRQKKEAEAARKAALAALEEREEAQLRAYWAAQARGAQGEAQHAGPQGRAGEGPAAAPVGRGAAQQGSRAGQQQREAPQPSRQREVPTHMAPKQGHQSYSSPGGARRGEALVQPGITVFLPPDKEAERRGALRARLASQSYSEEAEAGCASQEPPAAAGSHGGAQQKPSTPGGAAALQQALLQQAMAGGLLAAQQQQQQQAQALLVPWLAASNPALAALAGLPALGAALPQLLPPLPGVAAPTASTAAPAPAPSSSTDPQVLVLLRNLAAEQQRMREQLATQLDAVARLAGDATAVRSERDRARQDLERVQHMLAERQQAVSGSSGGFAAYSGGGEEDMLSVTTHVLPLGMGIPSRLGTPAGKAAPLQPALPARYREQALEPWQAQQQMRGGGAASKASGCAGAAAGSGRAGQAGKLSSSKGKTAVGAKAPSGGAARGTWRK